MVCAITRTEPNIPAALNQELRPLAEGSPNSLPCEELKAQSVKKLLTNFKR